MVGARGSPAETGSVRGALDGALEGARMGLTARRLAWAAGAAAGAGCAVVSAAVAQGFDAGAAGVVAAAVLASFSAFALAWRRPGIPAAARCLDEVLGTEAFGAATASPNAREEGGIASLTAREALTALGSDPPARLAWRGAAMALAGPALGIALLVLAPLAARTRGEGEGKRLADVPGGLLGARATALQLASEGTDPEVRAVAAQALDLTDRVLLAASRQERERLEAALARALEELERKAPGARLGPAAGVGRSEGGRRSASETPDGRRAASEAGSAAPERGDATPERVGGPARPSDGGAGTLSGPAGSAVGEGLAVAPPWPARYDAVVRLFLEAAPALRSGAESAPNPTQPHDVR